jgi:hypothetical protein
MDGPLLISPPVYIDGKGELIFSSPPAAERYLEAIDVRNGEYEAYDREGRRLAVD